MSEKLRKHLKQLSRKPLTENVKKHITPKGSLWRFVKGIHNPHCSFSIPPIFQLR